MTFPEQLAAGLAACALQLGVAAADPMTDIVDANAAFVEAFNTGDPSLIGPHYTEDAIALAPGWKIVEGREDIQTMYSAFFKAGFHDLDSETVTVEAVSDDVLVEVRREISRRTDGAGETTEHFFKLLAVWQRGEDGIWRMHRTSFNPRPAD